MKIKYLAILLVALAGVWAFSHSDKKEVANPLQNQTDALNAAKMVPSIQDKDAERRKKALDELN